ncbi:Apoptosis inhibitory protein 5 (API5) isoform 2 [Hibiscus syriacus]|uniref:Apoptosis inhibitory protein 5 (API5) isoform 2 n=1 Tax=Hibiscus syriacus TaxID=106335 RepID=A0A6A3BEX6_HIBSY|nr:Apoptosis inhibitory protein 5 (API5) isoform 2 [Hibiscus syriacus]
MTEKACGALYFLAQGYEEKPSKIEKLYEFGERLNEAKDKFQKVKEYYEGIINSTKTSLKAKQLAAQLIPRFFKLFPNLSSRALNAHFDLIEEEDLAVRVQAIRGLPLFCKNTNEYITKIVDILGQLLTTDEIVERDAVYKALMSVLRQDVKAPPERLMELIGIIEGQADLDAQFDVSDADHIDRLISCQFIALPLFARGASGSKFLNYLNKHIIPVFDKVAFGWHESLRIRGNWNPISSLSHVWFKFSKGIGIPHGFNFLSNEGKVKRTAAGNGSNNSATKKGGGAGGMQNQLVNRAFEGISNGGRGRGGVDQDVEEEEATGSSIRASNYDDD